MILEIASTKSLEAIDEALRAAAQRHQFGVLAMHDLKATMNSKGVAFDTPCRVYEICNPHQAKAVLEANSAVSTALPCRISVYGTAGGQHKIATIRPTALMKMFPSPALEPVAAEVEREITAIMNETA